MAGQSGLVVAWKDGDELRLQDAVGVAGHGSEETPVRDLRGDARRDRGAARAQLDEGALQRIEQEIEIEQPPNVVSTEDEHA